jgi:hypothetical protein
MILAPASLILLAAATSALAQDRPLPACFATEQAEVIEPRFPVLGAHADELSRLAAEDSRVPGTAVYLLARQMVLLERMQRRLQFHSDSRCGSALDSFLRDFAILRVINTAFIEGNAELAIARLESERARTLLANIDAELAGIADAVAALKPSLAP